MNALHEFNKPAGLATHESPISAHAFGWAPEDFEPASASVALPPTVEIMGFPICVLDTDQLVETAIARAVANERTTLCYVNAHVFNLAKSSERLAAALRGTDVLFADGVSVVWASRWARARLPERMTANDYFPRFMTRCAEEGLRLFLLGGRPGVAETAATAMRVAEPTLRIVGTHHGHFEPERDREVVSRVNASGADIVLTGLSTPRQETFLADQRDRLRSPIRWCVGAMFDYWAGLEAPAPAWACKWSAEWLYRLAVDPVGKWRRYLLGNPRFIWNTLCWGMGRQGSSDSEGTGRCH